MEDSPHADEVVDNSGGQNDPSLDTATNPTPEDVVADGDTPTDKTTDESGKDAPAGDTPAEFDDDLDEWAEKTGRGKPETDRERKLMQDIRNNQREFRSAKSAKEAKANLDSAIKDADPSKGEDDDELDPLEKKVAELEAQAKDERVARVQSEYFTEAKVTAEEAKVMGEILLEKAEKGGKTAFDYWTDPMNLQDWHQLAQARLAKGTDTSEVAEQAAQAERERLAKLSKATGTQRSASSTKTEKPKTDDERRMELWSK